METNKFFKSVMAGAAIGIGGWMYLLAPTPIVGAFIFACGLLCVRVYGLNLFTGKVQFMRTNQYKWTDYLIFFFGNMIGALIIALISKNTLGSILHPLIINKAEQPFLVALTKGFGCGALMSVATYRKSPLWLSIMCVMGFILAGFNHCVADAYYFMVENVIGWSFVATVIGNIIGGVCFSNLTRDEL